MTWGHGPLYLALLVRKNLLKEMSYGLAAPFCKQGSWESERQSYWLSTTLSTSFMLQAVFRRGPGLRISGLRIKAKLSNGTLDIFLLHLPPWGSLPSTSPHPPVASEFSPQRKKSDISQFLRVGRGYSVT